MVCLYKKRKTYFNYIDNKKEFEIDNLTRFTLFFIKVISDEFKNNI